MDEIEEPAVSPNAEPIDAPASEAGIDGLMELAASANPEAIDEPVSDDIDGLESTE